MNSPTIGPPVKPIKYSAMIKCDRPFKIHRESIRNAMPLVNLAADHMNVKIQVGTQLIKEMMTPLVPIPLTALVERARD